MSEDTTIRLKRTTKKRLDALLEEKGDTYDDLVRRLLKKVEEAEVMTENVIKETCPQCGKENVAYEETPAGAVAFRYCWFCGARLKPKVLVE